MMAFGWRPMMGCYATPKGQQDQPTTPATAGGQTTTAGATPGGAVSVTPCPSPTWFYVALAAAAFAGLTRR